AMQALALDDTDAEAHAALGWIKWHYDWDWSGAEQEYLQALRLQPSSSMAHGQYALYLDAIGRIQEGLREHHLVLALDPLSLISRTNLGDVFCLAGRYAEAAQEFQKTLELDANFADAHAGLGMTYIQQGRFTEGLSYLQRANELDTDPAYRAM